MITIQNEGGAVQYGTALEGGNAVSVDRFGTQLRPGLQVPSYAAFTVQATSATVETWLLYKEAAKTNLVATLVLEWVDASKEMFLGGTVTLA